MNATILVVDDDPNILRFLRVVLESEGYAITESATGIDVESLVTEAAPDLVLLDVMLPGRSGYEVCRSLKSNAASRHIPILMLTALRGRAEQARAIEADADDFMSKPIDREQLVGRVRAHLRVKPLYDEIKAGRREVERLTLELAERTAERDQARDRTETRDTPGDRLVRLATQDVAPSERLGASG